MSRRIIAGAVVVTSFIALTGCNATPTANRAAGHWEQNPGGGGRNVGLRWVTDRSAQPVTRAPESEPGNPSGPKGRWIPNPTAGGRSTGPIWVPNRD